MSAAWLSEQNRPAPGIVHLGIGAFFRAFGLPVIEDAIAASGGDWGVVGVSLRSAGIRDALEPQGCVYHGLERGVGGNRARAIGTLRQVLYLGEQRDQILAAMAAPTTHIVSLTITEKGYCHDPASGQLNPDHPDIRADLANPTHPSTAPGLITETLARRRAAGTPAFTCLSCDNLPANGPLLRGMILAFARLRDPALADWIAEHVAFPATMVDRITPATTPADIAEVTRLTGHTDAAPVAHEPFFQWVIEDTFTTARPDLAAAGVQMVSDVAPYEAAKLRCLNGTHSAIAYLGALAGLATVRQAVETPALATFIRSLWGREILPSLETPPGMDLPAYTDALMGRYLNPGIEHRTHQIAMDGSQKLPQRILGTVRDNLAAGRSVDRLATVVSAWMLYLNGRDQTGASHELSDPMAHQLTKAAASGDPIANLLALREIFGDDLPRNETFTAAVRRAHAALFGGVLTALEAS
jgi:fructuronate reductase